MELLTNKIPIFEGSPFLSLASLVLTVWLLGYVLYQQFLHPLAGYPGPFLASLTDLWQVYQFLTLRQPYHLTELHAKYGQFVRYGPDKLSITAEDAIPVIYQKGARSMPKTEFYDAFGSGVNPNSFGMRDEDMHSIRRRHMSNSFSISYVKRMEDLLDDNMRILKTKIAERCGDDDDKNEPFDLRRLIQFYIIDVLGELAFSQSFGIQRAADASLVPPVKEHTLLASATGAWPLMTARLKQWLPRVPLERLRRLFRGRAACAGLASQRVRQRLAALGEADDEKDAVGAAAGQRRDLLTNLILARHPDTGHRLGQTELETEAFGFIIAGTHTTSATASLLFYHLLHAPDELKKCVAELDENLPSLLLDGRSAYSISEVETCLPFLRTCIKENFRITPVFTMPLARRVMDPEGVIIAGHHIPQGTSVAVCNHAFHHNPDVWGADHDVFAPSRWDDPELARRARFLMHFGLGGRQCIGKAVAQANIYKLASTLLREFAFELADAGERVQVDEGAFVGRLPGLVSVGVSDLEKPLMVRARVRARDG